MDRALALQLLPARQRAALILCEVLDLPAAEAAGLMDVSVAAVKSLLQRARARIDQAALSDADIAEPTDEQARRVLDQYIAAFERSDAAGIERLLANDAVLEMTGTSTWFSGKATCAYHAFAIVVLATTRTHLSRITLFGDPELFRRFRLPPVQPGRRPLKRSGT